MTALLGIESSTGIVLGSAQAVLTRAKNARSLEPTNISKQNEAKNDDKKKG